MARVAGRKNKTKELEEAKTFLKAERNYWVRSKTWVQAMAVSKLEVQPMVLSFFSSRSSKNIYIFKFQVHSNLKHKLSSLPRTTQI